MPTAAMNTPLSQCHAWLDPTQYSVQLAKHTYTRFTLSWTAGGRQAGRRQGRSEEGWRVCGREQGEGGREQGEGGIDVTEGASGSGGREAGRLTKGERARKRQNDVGMERGRERRDRAREMSNGGSKGGGREGGREGGNKGAREGGKFQGRYPDEDTGLYTLYSAQNNPQCGPCP